MRAAATAEETTIGIGNRWGQALCFTVGTIVALIESTAAFAAAHDSGGGMVPLAGPALLFTGVGLHASATRISRRGQALGSRSIEARLFAETATTLLAQAPVPRLH